MSQIIVLQLLCLFSLFQVRANNGIHESIWLAERIDIANEIRNLGAGYRQILRDGWVRYLSLKNAAGRAGQCSLQVNTGMRDKIVVGDDE